MTQQSDWSNKLEHILADARIPKEQFATIENAVNVNPAGISPPKRRVDCILQSQYSTGVTGVSSPKTTA